MPSTSYLILAEAIMKKEDFLNTKWDARDWTEEMKRKWQEKMIGLGCYWFDAMGRVVNIDKSYYFIGDDGLLGFCFEHEYAFFSCQGRALMEYSNAFPETQTDQTPPEKPPVEQGQKHDNDKPRYDLLPPIAIDEMAKVMTFGAQKYAPDNWRHVDNAVERYRAALLRHSFAMLRGEKLDPETGLPHAAHAMCCASFLVELEAEDKQ